MNELSQVLVRTTYVANDKGAVRVKAEETLAVYGIGVISERTTRIESEGLFFNEETQTNIYHYDHLGSTIHVTDEAGNEKYHAQYGTYGELRRLTDADGNKTTPAEADLTYLYNGQYGVETEENGLYYMRTRYYNTSIKRFMNRDIINGDPTNAQSLNRFSYVQGNPISYTDPFGLSPEGVDYWLKYGHGILDLVGFIPGLGDVADFINALWYFQQGDNVTAILCLIAIVPVLGSLASKLFKGVGKAGSKFMKYLNSTGITDVITNWLKHAADSLSDVFKGGKIDLSAKNMEKVNEFLGKTKDDITEQISKKLDDWGCFIAGTKIKTADGQKNIEDIQAGDMVYAKNTETGEEGYKEVAQVFVKEVDTLVYLKVDGEEIVTTENHPFYIKDEGFVEAQYLEDGDTLLSADGTEKYVESVSIKQQQSPVKVYNFEVEDWHTYYVAGVEVLVHNKCSLDWDDYENYSSKSNKKPKKGKEFRGGSKKDRDKWYGKNDKEFQKWWEREGKKEWGGQDIENSDMANEVYEYWKESGSPKANGGKWKK